MKFTKLELITLDLALRLAIKQSQKLLEENPDYIQNEVNQFEALLNKIKI
jgi:hypothetical protein